MSLNPNDAAANHGWESNRENMLLALFSGWEGWITLTPVNQSDTHQSCMRKKAVRAFFCVMLPCDTALKKKYVVTRLTYLSGST